MMQKKPLRATRRKRENRTSHPSAQKLRTRSWICGGEKSYGVKNKDDAEEEAKTKVGTSADRKKPCRRRKGENDTSKKEDQKDRKEENEKVAQIFGIRREKGILRR
jgi:hypothetical protein